MLALDTTIANVALPHIQGSLSAAIGVATAERYPDITLSARLGAVRACAQHHLDTAQLFLAMGGGWWEWDGRPPFPSTNR